jgi:hypothetical protein
MKGRVKFQSEGVVMATVIDNAFGGRTGDQLGGATVQLDPGSSRGIDGFNDDVVLSSEDPVETYFACITSCSLDDGDCITICTEQLRESH